MRDVSTRMAEVLDGGQFDIELTIDVFYGAERTLRDLRVDPSWEVSWRRSADAPGSGLVLVMYDSQSGESVAPREFTDLLAPFGQEVVLKLTVSVGAEFREVVQLGRWQIDDVPSARDEHFRHLGRVVTDVSMVELSLIDQLEAVRADGFDRIESPRSPSAWDEMARLSGMKVLRSVPDATIPTSATWPAANGGRLDAIRMLADHLGGTPYVMSDGTLTVLPRAIGEIRRTFRLDEPDGTLLDATYSMSREGVYNHIVGEYATEQREPIVIEAAQITSGPLAVTGPFGRRTRYHRSPLVTTTAAAIRAQASELERTSKIGTFRMPVEAVIDPRVEIGDTVAIDQPMDQFVGSVAEVTFRGNGTMRAQVDVEQRISKE